MYFKIHVFLVSCIIVFAYNDEKFNILVFENLSTNKAEIVQGYISTSGNKEKK